MSNVDCEEVKGEDFVTSQAFKFVVKSDLIRKIKLGFSSVKYVYYEDEIVLDHTTGFYRFITGKYKRVNSKFKKYKKSLSKLASDNVLPSYVNDLVKCILIKLIKIKKIVNQFNSSIVTIITPKLFHNYPTEDSSIAVSHCLCLSSH